MPKVAEVATPNATLTVPVELLNKISPRRVVSAASSTALVLAVAEVVGAVPPKVVPGAPVVCPMLAVEAASIGEVSSHPGPAPKVISALPEVHTEHRTLNQ